MRDCMTNLFSTPEPVKKVSLWALTHRTSRTLGKFVLYRMREILTSKMYKEQFEIQMTRELDILKSKKDIAKIST